jgi:hypothetical protein
MNMHLVITKFSRNLEINENQCKAEFYFDRGLVLASHVLCSGSGTDACAENRSTFELLCSPHIGDPVRISIRLLSELVVSRIYIVNSLLSFNLLTQVRLELS